MPLLVKIFKAVANEKRIKILELLHKKKKVCLPEIKRMLRVSKPTACRHLKVLEHVNIISSLRQKRKIYFILNPKRVLRFNRKILKMIKQQRKR
ncbi:MAG: metalloregulator ArsR/SmtB family transcription factor [Elusimicrobiota bacterium]